MDGLPSPWHALVPGGLRSVVAQAFALGAGELRLAPTAPGRVFVHDGQIAWVAAGQDRTNLTTVLAEEEGLDRAVLQGHFEACRARNEPLGEALIHAGLIDEAALRAALLRHNARQLALLAASPAAAPEFLPRARRYAGRFLFGLDELLAPGACERPTVDAADAVAAAMAIEGAFGAAFVDGDHCVVALGPPDFDVELAATASAEVARAMTAMGQAFGGAPEDLVITSQEHLHVIHPLAGRRFLYLVVDRARGNVALARLRLRAIGEMARAPRTPSLSALPPR